MAGLVWHFQYSHSLFVTQCFVMSFSVSTAVVRLSSLSQRGANKSSWSYSTGIQHPNEQDAEHPHHSKLGEYPAKHLISSIVPANQIQDKL